MGALEAFASITLEPGDLAARGTTIVVAQLAAAASACRRSGAGTLFLLNNRHQGSSEGVTGGDGNVEDALAEYLGIWPALAQVTALATLICRASRAMSRRSRRARPRLLLGTSAVGRIGIAATKPMMVHMACNPTVMVWGFILHARDMMGTEGVTGNGNSVGWEGVIGTFPQDTRRDLGAVHVKGKRAGFMLLWPMVAHAKLEAGSLPSSVTARTKDAAALALTSASNDECCA